MKTAEDWVEKFTASSLNTDAEIVAYFRAIQLDAMEAQHRATMDRLYPYIDGYYLGGEDSVENLPRPEPEGECTEP